VEIKENTKMLFTVSLNAPKEWEGSKATLMGAFLMKRDAENFLNGHNLKGELVLAEVDNVWHHFEAIRGEGVR
jgi:hypothetical protein